MTAQKPKLRFPEFSNEWRFMKLKDVSSYSDQRIAFKELNSDNFVGVDNLISNLGGKSSSNYVPSSGQVTKYITGDTLHSNIRPYLKKAWLSDIEGGASADILVMRPNNIIRSNFFYYIITLDSYFDYVVSGSKGVKMPRGDKSHIMNYEAAIPDTTEQQKIADFLTAVDERIELISKKVDLLKQYKKSVMQKIFCQQIRFKDKNGNSYPDWGNVKLSKLADDGYIKLGRGDIISKTDIVNNPGIFPIYSSSVQNSGLFGRYGKYMFNEELITWSIDGGGHFFYRPNEKFSVTNVSGWLRVLSPEINCRFLALQLQLLHEKLFFDYQTKAHPSVIRNIYKLNIPVFKEQQKIANFLTALDDKINLTEKESNQAKQFKKALLQRMFV